MKTRYRCPKCGAVAEIDRKRKTIIIETSPPKIPKPTRGRLIQVSLNIPSHTDCEFAKPIDKIDISKLEPVEGYEFAHERRVPL